MNIKTDKKTTYKNTGQLVGKEVIATLNACTLNMPKKQTLQELQIIVERLSFGEQRIKKSISLDDIDTMLAGDISDNTMQFVRWLYHRKLIGLLAGDHGRTFLAFCVRYYRTVEEIRCITPIEISDSCRVRLLTHLRKVYPEPARIVFEDAPSLILGCVIDDGISKVNMSLQEKAPHLIRKYIMALKPLEIGDHER